MASLREPSRSILAPQSLADRILAEGAVSLHEGIRAEGLSASPKTARRWRIRGVGGTRLEAVRVGGRWLTSRAAVRRFVAAQQRETPPAVQAIDVAAADAVLAAHGLGRAVCR